MNILNNYFQRDISFFQFHEKYHYISKIERKLQISLTKDIFKNDYPKHKYSTFSPAFDFSCLYNI